MFTTGTHRLKVDAEVEVLAVNEASTTNYLEMFGNGFSQQIYGNAGANILTGGGGTDTLVGYDGNDLYLVDDASDVVVETAGGGSDEVYTTASYTLSANAEVERLSVNVASDTSAINLTGNGFAQTIVGGNGVNIITGGGGADTLIGGAGADRFVYNAAAESTTAARDVIVDFAAGDKIDFSALDASTAPGQQGFTFIGANGFTNSAGQLRVFQSGASWFVEGDVDGNGQADLSIQVQTGGYALTQTDFIGLAAGAASSAEAPSMLLMSLAEAGLPDNGSRGDHKVAANPAPAGAEINRIDLVTLAQTQEWGGPEQIGLQMVTNGSGDWL